MASTTSPTCKLVRMPERHDRQMAEIDFQQRQIRVGIPADDPRHGHPAVGELHAHLVGVLHDVIVGGDVPLGIHDDAGAETAFGEIAIARREVAEKRLKAAGLNPLGNGAGGVDIDHRRACALYCVGVGPGIVAGKQHGRLLPIGAGGSRGGRRAARIRDDRRLTALRLRARRRIGQGGGPGAVQAVRP